MQQALQFYIDTYSNSILNHLLLAENTTGINIIELGAMPAVKILPTGSHELQFKNLGYLFDNYLSIELDRFTIDTNYEISLYFMCHDKALNISTKEALFNSHYQVTQKDFLIMTLYTGENSAALSSKEKLMASSLLTCSLNLTLNQNYKFYEQVGLLVRQFVIHFYSPTLNQIVEKENALLDRLDSEKK